VSGAALKERAPPLAPLLAPPHAPPLIPPRPALTRPAPFPRAAGWSADEELQLLEGIEIYGLGNWHEIASYLGGAKTDAQCARQ
jgi:hypothetical protein